MKSLATLLVLFAFVLGAGAQDKPRIFVQGKGSENLVTSGSWGRTALGIMGIELHA